MFTSKFRDEESPQIYDMFIISEETLWPAPKIEKQKIEVPIVLAMVVSSYFDVCGKVFQLEVLAKEWGPLHDSLGKNKVFTNKSMTDR
jgi:hypothetical protein